MILSFCSLLRPDHMEAKTENFQKMFITAIPHGWMIGATSISILHAITLNKNDITSQIQILDNAYKCFQ